MAVGTTRAVSFRDATMHQEVRILLRTFSHGRKEIYGMSPLLPANQGGGEKLSCVRRTHSPRTALAGRGGANRGRDTDIRGAGRKFQKRLLRSAIGKAWRSLQRVRAGYDSSVWPLCHG